MRMPVRWRYLFSVLWWCAPLSAAQNLPGPPDPVAHPPPTAAAPADGMPTVAMAAPASASPGVTLSAEQWARPRSGAAIVQLPGLAALVEAMERDGTSRLVIRFSGGDEGTLWAEELRSWLVALGWPAARIELEAGWPQPDALRLELRAPR